MGLTITANSTSQNVGGTIVQRDASGNFSAGTVTFNSIPVGPNADPTTDNQLARKAYIDKLIGDIGVILDNIAGV
jgi:hypothetical protein